MRRSVERVKGVTATSFDLTTGTLSVTFESPEGVEPQTLWKAVREGGFTPVEVKTGGRSFTGQGSQTTDGNT